MTFSMIPNSNSFNIENEILLHDFIRSLLHVSLNAQAAALSADMYKVMVGHVRAFPKLQTFYMYFDLYFLTLS